MITIIGLIFLFTSVGTIETSVLVKKKYWRELITFSVLFLIAFGLSLLYASGVQLPSPMQPIRYGIENILHLKY
jgi:hypothetical protein